MVCTTFLHDSELNQVLPDPNVQRLLTSVRDLTGENWQIVPHVIRTNRLFRKPLYETFYGLYLYVGGCGTWQQINFYSSPEEFSLNLNVDLGTISNFLMGICNGYRYGTGKIVK